jgi:hypothetical protein
VSLAEVRQFHEAWRIAERSLVERGRATPNGAGRQEIVDVARETYLDVVRKQVASHGYAWGQRSIHADIEELQEADRRRSSCDPGTPEHDEAVLEHRRRNYRIFAQLHDDHARSEETRQALRRLMGLPDEANGLERAAEERSTSG